MRVIRTYEAFWNRKKETPRMSAKELVEYTISNYKDMEDNSDLFEVTIDDNYATIAWEKSFRDKGGKYHVSVSNRDGNFQLIDFYDEKGESMYGKYDNGMTKVNTRDTEITESEFNDYYKKLSDISDFLLESEEEKERKSKVSVSEDGIVNLENNPLDQIGFMLTEHLKRYVGKNYKFETLYYVWSASDKNEKFIEDVEFKLKGFKVGMYMGDERKLYGLATVECSLDGKEYELWVNDDYKAEYVDLEKNPFTKDAIRPHQSEKMGTRKMHRFYKDKSNYPHNSVTLLSPSEYSTIEMLKDFVGEIRDFNEQIRNNFK